MLRIYVKRLPSGMVIRNRWAVYISSRRDFSQAASRRAAAQDKSIAVDGHANNRRFDPAVLRVRTSVNLLDGVEDVAGTVTDPRTCTNYDKMDKVNYTY
jgi:hypothetical protein